MGPVRATIQYDGYMELRELAHLFGLDEATIRRRLHAQGRSLYAYTRDKRLRMVREEDMRAIFQIIPAPQRIRDDGRVRAKGADPNSCYARVRLGQSYLDT